jgi:hypothetical protein
MRDQVRRRLHLLDRDIASVRVALAMDGEELAARQAALDEARLRSLIAETPVADLELHEAAVGVIALRERVRRAERDLAALLEQRRALSGRLQPAGTDA